MATYNERKQFISSIIQDDLLEEAISWIKSNMNPAEIFDEEQLDEWANDNDYVKRED